MSEDIVSETRWSSPPVSPGGILSGSRAMLLRESWGASGFALGAAGYSDVPMQLGHDSAALRSNGNSSRGASSRGFGNNSSDTGRRPHRLNEPFPEPLCLRMETLDDNKQLDFDAVADNFEEGLVIKHAWQAVWDSFEQFERDWSSNSPSKRALTQHRSILKKLEAQLRRRDGHSLQGRATKVRATIPFARRLSATQETLLLVSVFTSWRVAATQAVAAQRKPSKLNLEQRNQTTAYELEEEHRNRRREVALTADAVTSLMVRRHYPGGSRSSVGGVHRNKKELELAGGLLIAGRVLVAWRLQARTGCRVSMLCRRRAEATNVTSALEASRLFVGVFSCWSNLVAAGARDRQSSVLESEHEVLEAHVQVIEAMNAAMARQLEDLARRHETLGEHCVETLRRAEIWSSGGTAAGAAVPLDAEPKPVPPSGHSAQRQRLPQLLKGRQSLAAEWQKVVGQVNAVSQKMGHKMLEAQGLPGNGDAFETRSDTDASVTAKLGADAERLAHLQSRDAELRQALLEADRAIEQATASTEECLQKCLRGLQSHFDKACNAERRRVEELRNELARAEREALQDKSELELGWRRMIDDSNTKHAESELQLASTREKVQALMMELEEAKAWADHLREVDHSNGIHQSRQAEQERQMMEIKQVMTELVDISANCFGNSSTSIEGDGRSFGIKDGASPGNSAALPSGGGLPLVAPPRSSGLPGVPSRGQRLATPFLPTGSSTLPPSACASLSAPSSACTTSGRACPLPRSISPPPLRHATSPVASPVRSPQTGHGQMSPLAHYRGLSPGASLVMSSPTISTAWGTKAGSVAAPAAWTPASPMPQSRTGSAAAPVGWAPSSPTQQPRSLSPTRFFTAPTSTAPHVAYSQRRAHSPTAMRRFSPSVATPTVPQLPAASISVAAAALTAPRRPAASAPVVAAALTAPPRTSASTPAAAAAATVEER